MNKAQVYEFLKNNNIEHEITEHQPVFTMGELFGVEVPYPECDAKNLFVRDDKHRKYYLITVKGDKRVNLKEFRNAHGTRPLTFASADELSSIMGLIPGSVSPFGLFNDENRVVDFYIDEDFFTQPYKIGVHPNENTATVWLNADDLVSLVDKHGNAITKIKI
ncbi:MAG: prolyl-tRNA synthetase associated domain-containing protein [Clostridia bacterium]|nr:prolyl-tRNA synthetase associated domain-containing protein [Clostridia bacterium]